MSNELVVPFRHCVSGMMIAGVVLDIAQATGAQYLEHPVTGAGVACVCAAIESCWDITVHAVDSIDSKVANGQGIDMGKEYDFVLVTQKLRPVSGAEIDDFRSFEVFMSFVETFRYRVNNLRRDPRSHFSH